jgi:hypothetical protein
MLKIDPTTNVCYKEEQNMGIVWRVSATKGWVRHSLVDGRIGEEGMVSGKS